MGQIGQTCSHAKHEPDPFIKQVSHVNPNITWTRLASTHNLFTNGLFMSGLLVVSDFAIPKFYKCIDVSLT